MKNILIILCLALIVSPAYSADTSGTAYGSFLKIGTSSRLIGRGEAVTAMVDDPSALTANVGGLAGLNKMEILFSHYEWLLDLDYEHLAVVRPMLKGTMGFGLTYLHLPAFPRYNDWGEEVGELNANSLAFIVGYGKKFKDFAPGISMKVIRESFGDAATGEGYDGYAFASDLGVIHSLKFPANVLGGRVLKTGLTMQNLGTSIKGYSAPMAVKFGVGSEIINDLAFETDVEYPFDSNLRINLGAEYNIRNYFNIRLGYRFMGYEPDSFTLGAGLRYPFDNKIVKVESAYAPEGVLNNTMNLSFGVEFPGIDTEKEWRIANTLYYKGIYYYTNGDLKQAIELWKEALKHNPGHTKAKEKIKDAEYLLKLQEVEKDVKDEYKEGIKKDNGKKK